MGLGGGETVISGQEMKKAFNAFDSAFEAGIRHFDLADIYNGGRSEVVFGKWLQMNPSIRKEIFIQSKCGIQLHVGPLNSSFYNFSPQYIINQVEKSLAQIQINTLDMLFLHRPDPLARAEDLKDVFLLLKSTGKVQNFGVSNMSAGQIEWISRATGEPVKANQIQFGLGHALMLDHQAQVNTYTGNGYGLEGMQQYSMMHNIELQAWRPLDKGRFLSIHADSSACEYETSGLLKKVAEKYDVSPSAVALNWVMQVPNGIAPVIGTTNPSRIKALAQALDFEITREEWYSLWITARDKKLP